MDSMTKYQQLDKGLRFCEDKVNEELKEDNWGKV